MSQVQRTTVHHHYHSNRRLSRPRVPRALRQSQQQTTTTPAETTTEQTTQEENQPQQPQPQSQPPPPQQQQTQRQYTRRTAPNKKELGQAGWTLIHSIAANYPQAPTDKDKFHASAFLTSIAHLYPCKLCRRHFERYITAYPPDLSSREAFMLWTCQSHNAVNKRNGKREFPCNLQSMEYRWGDCGCQRNKKN